MYYFIFDELSTIVDLYFIGSNIDDMPDLPALMEPMRPTDSTGLLQDLALALQTKSAILSGVLHPKTRDLPQISISEKSRYSAIAVEERVNPGKTVRVK